MTIPYLGFKLYHLIQLPNRTSTDTITARYGAMRTNAAFIEGLENFIEDEMNKSPALGWVPNPFSASAIGRWISDAFRDVDDENGLDKTPRSFEEKSAYAKVRLQAELKLIRQDSNSLKDDEQYPVLDFVEEVFHIPQDIMKSANLSDFMNALYVLYLSGDFKRWRTIAEKADNTGLTAQVLDLDEQKQNNFHLLAYGLAKDSPKPHFTAKVKDQFSIFFQPVGHDNHFNCPQAHLNLVVVHTSGNINVVCPNLIVDDHVSGNRRQLSGFAPFEVTPPNGLGSARPEAGWVVMALTKQEYPLIDRLESLPLETSISGVGEEDQRETLGQFAAWIEAEYQEGRALLRALPYEVIE